MRITRHSSGSSGPGFLRIASGTLTLPASCSSAATSMSSSAALVDPQLLADAHRPFGQARAVHARVEVLEVQHLVSAQIVACRVARTRSSSSCELQRVPGEPSGHGATMRAPAGSHWAGVQSTPSERRSSRPAPAARQGPQHGQTRGRGARRRSSRPWPSLARSAAWRFRSPRRPGRASAAGWIPMQQRGRSRDHRAAEGRAPGARVGPAGIGRDDPLAGSGQTTSSEP